MAIAPTPNAGTVPEVPFDAKTSLWNRSPSPIRIATQRPVRSFTALAETLLGLVRRSVTGSLKRISRLRRVFHDDHLANCFGNSCRNQQYALTAVAAAVPQVRRSRLNNHAMVGPSLPLNAAACSIQRPESFWRRSETGAIDERLSCPHGPGLITAVKDVLWVQLATDECTDKSVSYS